MKIVLNNNKCRLVGDVRIIMKLRDLTKLRSPGAFYSPAYRKRIWDGYVKYVSEDTGMFPTGLLPRIIELLKNLKQDIEISDVREHIKKSNNIKELGGLVLRDYQLAGSKAVIKNRVEGFRFTRGILHEATNAGKNLIAASLFASYPRGSKGLFLINNTEIFSQAVEELSELLPGLVGQVSSKKTDLKHFNVCMVQTLANRIKSNSTLRNQLQTYDILIVDEADEVCNRKDTKFIMNTCYNSTIRVALTGTAGMSKDKTKNQDLINYFGPVLHRTTNIELIDKGVSTPPRISFVMGNKKGSESTWPEEYSKKIIKNKQRNKKIWKIVKKQCNKNKIPIIILIKLHDHINQLMKVCPPSLQKVYNIQSVHHKTKARPFIIKDFKDGKIDILICSMIIKRGKNLPLIQTLINASGGTSEENVLQILGRALRSHHSKKYVSVIDFWDEGQYLRLHSKRRIRYYKQDGHKVKELYKKYLKKNK